MNKKIGLMLDLIYDVVQDDSLPWKEKRDLIHKIAEGNDRFADALNEFFGWFGEEDEEEA